MNDFETTLRIDKIKSQKYGKGLVEDIIIIKDWYYTNPSLSRSNHAHALVCNAYRCITLAISLYIIRCSSPLPTSVYKVKRSMEEEILSEEFLNTDEPTYEWLIDTFQYTVDIPADIPNSFYTQVSGKQISVIHNLNYVIFNKLALLIGDKTIPFTIDFNSSTVGYYEHLISDINGKPHHIMAQLIVIQGLKIKADSSIIYTLFEEALNENLEKLSLFRAPLSFIRSAEPLRGSVRAVEVLALKYTKHLTIENKRQLSSL